MSAPWAELLKWVARIAALYSHHSFSWCSKHKNSSIHILFFQNASQQNAGEIPILKEAQPHKRRFTAKPVEKKKKTAKTKIWEIVSLEHGQNLSQVAPDPKFIWYTADRFSPSSPMRGIVGRILWHPV
uniref:Putative secreted protein n=1 Tax=Amblyomma triste TaxID=251400 RepID=A0A023G4I9_AMBTT